MTECILVTDKEYEKSKAVFESVKGFEIKSAPTQEQALSDAIIDNDCRAVIIGVDKYSSSLYKALAETGGEKGAVIARYGVGHDGVDKKLARGNNIVVTNTPGVLDQSVAEHAICLMGALNRNIAKLDAEMRSGEFGSQMGMEVAGKTLGIIGFGAIGRQVAKIASFGFAMKVIAADVHEFNADEIKTLKNNFGIDSYNNNVNAVLDQADIVSVHLPVIPETRHFFNAERFAAMKTDARFINTARGSIVDENSLYDALTSGQLAGAALDVFEQEPYIPTVPDKDLRKLENVLITPHIGSNTRESNKRMSETCLQNIAHFFAGEIDKLNLIRIP